MDKSQRQKPAEATARAVRLAGESTIPRIDSEQLLARGSQLIIVHGNREYRLRKTSQGKLILTA